jgi:hypothetical protein
MASRLFISFAQADEEFREALEMHLAPLVNNHSLLIDDATKIDPGDEVRPARLALLGAADVIVLLLSPRFFANKEIINFDLPRVMARNSAERVPIVPVLVRECRIEQTPLEGRRILPAEDKPIGSPTNDRLLAEVARSVHRVLDGLPRRAVAHAVRVTQLPALPVAGATEELIRTLFREALRSLETAPIKASTSQLEAVFLKSVGFQNVVSWRGKMGAAERCVCRIRGKTGGDGTGFLVSPRHVMTNMHVASILRGGGAFQFDYKEAADGTIRPCKVEVGPISAVVKSPIEELDYAIFELPEAIGEQPSGDSGPARGYLRLSDLSIEERSPLFILQHPAGDVLKMCVGAAVKGDNPKAHRVYYETNTEAGSSGSPVFTIDWELVALHHAWDVGANRGIPMRDIVADLRRQDALSLIGPP